MKKYLIQDSKQITELRNHNYVIKNEYIQEVVDFETLLIKLK